MPIDEDREDSGGIPDPIDTSLAKGMSPSEPLTTDERETLRRVLELGYFEVPKTVTLVDFGEDLGRSDVTVSREPYRGMGIVLRTTLTCSTHPPS